MCEILTVVAKWQETYVAYNKDLWQDIFTFAFEICEETLFQTFQYKILKRFFPCIYVLSKWYMDKLEICEYCTLDSDTLEHYFFYRKDFWMSLYKWWKRYMVSYFLLVLRTFCAVTKD